MLYRSLTYGRERACMILTIFLILLLISFLSLLYVNQRRLIYFPSDLQKSPSQAGVPEMQVVNLQTEDGLNLKAWYRESKSPPLPTIIFFHGNAGNIGNRSFLVKPFLNEGFGVLLVTYRGYSGNPGSPSEEGFYKDARSAIQFLLNKKIPEKSLVLYGESIGGAVATKMGTEYYFGALILQSPFSSLAEIGQYHYPFFPVKWVIKDQFNSHQIAHQIKSPTLVLYGESDDIIPPKDSLKLYSAIEAQKQLYGFPHIGHNDGFNPNISIDFINKHVSEKF